MVSPWEHGQELENKSSATPWCLTEEGVSKGLHGRVPTSLLWPWAVGFRVGAVRGRGAPRPTSRVSALPQGQETSPRPRMVAHSRCRSHLGPSAGCWMFPHSVPGKPGHVNGLASWTEQARSHSPHLYCSSRSTGEKRGGPWEEASASSPSAQRW